MNGRIKKNFGFSLMLVAFFFLFDPSYALIDPLPDFIGYSILCFAIINLADINDRIHAALKSFRLGIVFSLLRIVTYFVIENMFATEEQTIGLLLFVFIFAMCDIIWIIPGYRSLFDGLLSLGMFEGGEAIYYKKHENGRNASEKLKVLTIVFIIFKDLVWLLPELTALETNTSNEFIGIMRILSVIIMMPISVIWLVGMAAYIVRIIKDRAFIDALEKKYRDRTEGANDFFACRYVLTYLAVMIAAFILSIDVYSNNVNYLPDVVFYIALIISVFMLKRHSRMWLPITLFSILGGVSSVIIFLSEKEFFSTFSVESIRRDPNAYNEYNLLLTEYIIQAMIFAVISILTMLFIAELFKKRLLKNDEEGRTISIKSKDFSIKAVIYSVLSILSAFGSVYYAFSLPLYTDSWIYAYSNVISASISICFVISAYTLIRTVADKLKNNTQQYL